MPKVADIPIGQDVTLIKGLTERARSVEALRNQLGLSVNNVVGTIPQPSDELNPPWVYPDGWPSITVNVQASGAIFTIFGGISLSGDGYMRLGPSVDGADPVEHGFSAGPTLNSIFGLAVNGGCAIALSGITPGWHTISLGAQSILGAGGTVGSPWLMAWTF